MLPRDRGTIIQVGSALAFRLIPLESAYCASKHAIQRFTESLRAELIHGKSNVGLSVMNMPALNTTQFVRTKNKTPHKAADRNNFSARSGRCRNSLRCRARSARDHGWSYPRGESNPGLLDHYLATAAWEGSMLPEAADPDEPDNFWQPLSGDHGSHGPFDGMANRFSFQLWATENRSKLLGGLMLAGVGFAGADFSQRKSLA